MNKHQHRLRKERFFYYFLFFLSSLCFIPLFLILAFILYKGLAHFSLNLFFESFPSGSNNSATFGKGGILPAIVGSLLIIFFAFIIGAPIGSIIGVSIGENPKSALSRLSILSSDVIQGTPAIVIGLISYYWFVLPFKQFSGFSAALAFSIMILPLIITSASEATRKIPKHLIEASYALGATRFKTTRHLVFPLVLPSIINATILSLARVLGESAPLLFTAFGSSLVQFDMREPMHSMSLLIFQYANSPFLNQQQLAWNASLILVSVILIFNLIAKFLYKRLRVVL